MNDARRRALVVATATKWLAVAAALAAPWAADGVTQQVALFVVTVIGVTLRVDDRTPALSLAGTVICAAAAAAAAGASGGPRSFAFAAVITIAADAAVQWGGGVGGVIGAGGSLATVVTMLVQPGSVDLDPVDIYALALTMLTGLAFGTIQRDLPITGVVALRATTQALDELVALTRRVQPGLDRWAVADAVLVGLRDHAATAGGRSAVAGPHLLVEVNGVLHGVGAPWHRRPLCLSDDLPRQRRGRSFRAVPRASLPDAIRDELQEPRWLVHRLDDSSGGGAVLVDAGTDPAVLDRVADTIATGTIALANSARFERLRAAATDAARTRLAHDLHDGIAQALTHARFELELLSMEHEEEPEGLARARSAADAALLEVRRTIGQLREDLTLADALDHHVDTVRDFARVPIELEVRGDAEPADPVAEQVFRVAQEALSNALRHSACSTVTISLRLDEEGLVLSVADDGVGIDPAAPAGVGSDAMRERARAVGGDLTVARRPGGGTVVTLAVRGAGTPAGVGAGPVSPPRGRPNVRPADRALGWLGLRARRGTTDE